MTRDLPWVPLLDRAGRLCREQADDMVKVVGRVVEDRAPDTAEATHDHKALLKAVRAEDRKTLWGKAFVGCLNQTVNVIDHTRALGILLSDPGQQVPMYAHASLARVAVESAALLLHVLARDEPFPTRFARGVALLHADATMALRSATRTPGNAYMPSPRDQVAGERDQLIELIERARIVLVPNADGKQVKAVRVADGVQASVNHKATDLAERAFADLPDVYGMLSGVVHGLPWRLGDSATIAGRDAAWEPDPIDVAASALVAAHSAHRTTAAVAWYRGYEDDPGVVRMLARTRDLDEAMQAYGRQGLLAHARPTIARFLQQQPRQ